MDKKDKKILANIDKLLLKYGVSKEEKNNFMNDLINMKDDEDEEEAVEQTTEDEAVGEEETATEETPKEEESVEETTETTEEETVEEPVDSNTEEAPVEEVANDSEQVSGAEPVENTPETPVEQNPTENVDYQAKYEECQKAVNGLMERLNSLEQALQAVGVLEPKPAEEEQKEVINQEPSEGADFAGSLDDTLRKLNR